MNAQKLFRHNINLNEYIKKYSSLVASDLLDSVIAMKVVYGEEIDRQTVLKLNKTEFKLDQMMKFHPSCTPLNKRRFFVLSTLDTTPDKYTVIRLLSQYNVYGYALYELYLNEMLTLEDVNKFIDTKILSKSSDVVYTYLADATQFGSTTLTYLNLGLTDEEFDTLTLELRATLTMETLKHLDTLMTWHLLELIYREEINYGKKSR